MEVHLELLSEKHAYTSYQWRNDPEVWRYTFNKPNKTVELQDELDWIRKVISIENDARFAIIADDIYVGNIYLTGIKDDFCFYGIFIGNREFWGKGVGRKASELILEYARDVLKLKSVFLRVKKDNVAGVKLYNNIGFTSIKEEEDHYLMEYKIG